jgi:hypothetical protein
MAGNVNSVAYGGQITTSIGTSATLVHQVGPVTTTVTGKYTLMALIAYVHQGYMTQMTIGRSSVSLASAANCVSVINGASPLVLPSGGTCFYVDSNSDTSVGNSALKGFATDSPGAGTFYYTVWMSSDTPFNYNGMAASLTVFSVGF